MTTLAAASKAEPLRYLEISGQRYEVTPLNYSALKLFLGLSTYLELCARSGDEDLRENIGQIAAVTFAVAALALVRKCSPEMTVEAVVAGLTENHFPLIVTELARQGIRAVGLDPIILN